MTPTKDGDLFGSGRARQLLCARSPATIGVCVCIGVRAEQINNDSRNDCISMAIIHIAWREKEKMKFFICHKTSERRSKIRILLNGNEFKAIWACEKWYIRM